MDSNRLITLCIHTFRKANDLKAVLEQEGVEVTLQNVNLSSPIVSSGVRVRIHEDDLPLALRIVENPDIFARNTNEPADPSSAAHSILLPVDFTERALQAAKVAFSIASQTGDRIVLLHSYLVPRSSTLLSLSNSLTFDSNAAQLDDAKESVIMAQEAHNQMASLTAKIKLGIKRGEISPAKFSSVLLEGVPEECIDQFIKEHHEVRLIVMGTRPAAQKAHDLAGSIAAEVMDNVRITALTVPESATPLTSLAQVRQVTLLSNMEQEDFLALDALHRLMPEGATLAVKVVCLPEHRYTRATNSAARTALRQYCAEHFPDYQFTMVTAGADISELEKETADLVVVPNRKKNIFARLLNPGLAHRILFHTDIPMMVIPV